MPKLGNKQTYWIFITSNVVFTYYTNCGTPLRPYLIESNRPEGPQGNTVWGSGFQHSLFTASLLQHLSVWEGEDGDCSSGWVEASCIPVPLKLNPGRHCASWFVPLKQVDVPPLLDDFDDGGRAVSQKAGRFGHVCQALVCLSVSPTFKRETYAATSPCNQGPLPSTHLPRVSGSLHSSAHCSHFHRRGLVLLPWLQIC